MQISTSPDMEHRSVRSGAVCTERQAHGFKIPVGLQRSEYNGLSDDNRKEQLDCYSFVQNRACLASYIARTANASTDQSKTVLFAADTGT
jgi:hypothetical protein